MNESVFKESMKFCVVLFVLGLAFGSVLASPFLFAQAEATTDDGEHAHIFDDDLNLADPPTVDRNEPVIIMAEDPWDEKVKKWMRELEERIEYNEKRVCGHDPATDMTDKKCNATLLFDLPANTTISLRKHLRSHARLKRRVLTLERMMRVVMAYQKLGVGLRAQQQQQQRDKK